MEKQTDKEHRLNRRSTLLHALEDVLPADGDVAASALLDLALSLMQKKHAAVLDRNSTELVRENYPDATVHSIADRAMTDEGVFAALGVAHYLGIIAVDYNPNSHCVSDIARDKSIGKEGLEVYHKELFRLFQAALNANITPFGVATTMVLLGVTLGLQSGVHPIKMSRPLLDGLALTVKESESSVAKNLSNDETIKQLMKVMGVSKAVASKFAKRAMGL